MATAIATLRELHRLRLHARSLQDEVDRIPRQIRARQTALAKQEEGIKAAHEALNQIKLQIRNDEGALKQHHQQIAKWEQQLRDISSKKEYDALQHEIEGAKTKCTALEDAILERLTKVEEQGKRLPELEKTLTTARADMVAFEKASAERAAVLRKELAKTAEEVQGQENLLPKEFRTTYDRLVQAMGQDALSLIHEKTCTACNTGLTHQNYNDLISGRLVMCTSCGRITYLKGDM